MPKPMEYLEKFYKLSPYVLGGVTLFNNQQENLKGLAGWLSGETYTGNNTYADRIDTSTMFGTGSPKKLGAFGGFESTARDFLTSKGYSQLGDLAGDTINLIGEIASAPFELGFQTMDIGKGFLKDARSLLPDWVVDTATGLGEAYTYVQGQKAKGRDDDRGKQGDRPKFKKVGYGQRPSLRKLADAKKAERLRQKNYYGGVYDPKVAQLLNYAFHELQPTFIKESGNVKTKGLTVALNTSAIGRGKGLNV